MVDELKKLKIGKIISKPYMKDYTTYKVGGMALALVIPDDLESLIKLLKYIEENKIKYKIIGNGSNLLFNDDLFNGIIIKLDKFDNLEIENNKVIVGAGYSLIKLAYKVSKIGLTGLEFATGIPGTVGGAIYMNAGAYKSDMGYIVNKVKVLTPDFKVITLYNKDLNFHYRDSFFQHNNNYICLEVNITLKKGKVDSIMEVINERKKRRMESQPLEYPSAGSVFRNPENDFAGRLIEELGYKGKYIGGAQVSEKHANFIINKKNATACDIRTLILEIRNKIKEKYDIDLKIEQEFVD